jgi:protein MpaA
VKTPKSILLLALTAASFCVAWGWSSSSPTPTPSVSVTPELSPSPIATVAPVQKVSIEEMCKNLDADIAPFKWKIKTCDGIAWRVGGQSVEGRPLIYAEFGDPTAKNTTLIFSSVHGDEITPIYIGFELVQWLKQHQEGLRNTHVVVAPFVNPDGFFLKPRTRMNSRGVDLNRNFATKDWPDHALMVWKGRFHSDPRRFPGASPQSEPETIFQEELIRQVRPTKILSVHSPLNFLDYDGPSSNLALEQFGKDYVQKCLELRRKVRAISAGFFVGSLGNYSGQEQGIPTLTLELPTSDPTKAEAYWKKFSQGIKTVIEYKIPGYVNTTSAHQS